MKKFALTMLLSVCIAALPGCGSTGSSSAPTETATDTPAPEESSENIQTSENGYSPVFTEEAANVSWEEKDATHIRFNDAEITVEGEGAAALEGGIKISQGGVYVLEGTLTDGKIVADVEPGDVLTLVLNGVDVTCSTSAPLYISNGDAIIILAEGTENVLTDGQTYQYADASVKEPNACIYGDDNLTIIGKGALTVNANFNNGIGSKDELRIANASLTVKAINNAIKGNDCVLIRDAQIRLESEGDGIKSDEEKTAGYGIIEISGSSLDITAADDGLQAVSRITALDGEIITSVQGKKVNCDGIVSIAEGVLQ